jgi:hypothetical protein
VAGNLLKGNYQKPNYLGIPSVVSTIPPLAAVGLSERGASEQNLKFRVKTEMTSSWYSSRHPFRDARHRSKAHDICVSYVRLKYHAHALGGSKGDHDTVHSRCGRFVQSKSLKRAVASRVGGSVQPCCELHLLERWLVESHTTIIIPFDDCVLFVRSLNCAEFSSRLSEVTQTLGAISGI